MLKAIFSPITLAFIGLTLVTLAASNATENENERTEQMLKKLIKAQVSKDAEQSKNPSPTPPAGMEGLKEVRPS